MKTNEPWGIIDAPFSVRFNWQGKARTITLERGEDILRLANIYKEILNRNDIEYKETVEL